MGYKILADGGRPGSRDSGPEAETRVAYGFTVGAYDPAQTLILDPVILVYCGYIGGPSYDYGYGIAVDSAGSAYITGYTYAPGAAFPTKVGPDLTYNGGSMDAFVAKLNPEGTGYVYCGYIGGSGNDYGYGIALDAFGSAYVAGYTSSAENTFPVKVGPGLKAHGDYDVFVAKVNPKGTGLDYCGFIGGSGSDFGKGIAVDGVGNAYVTGYTNSTEADFPVTVGPFLTSSGDYDAFVAKIDASGASLAYCGYIGGIGEDVANAVAVDGLGCAYITGFTFSGETSFPVTTGPTQTLKGLSDAFAAKVNSDGASLAYCGYIGGAGSDVGTGIAVDLGGNAYICGYTNSTEASFPVSVGPSLTFKGGTFDAFAAKLEAGDGLIAYAGFIGGGLYDVANAIAVDGRGYAYVTGYTSSKEDTFLPVDGPSLTHAGSYDAFVAKVDISGAKLLLSGYLGGADADLGMGIALGPDGSGDIYLTGNTLSDQATFPVVTGPDLAAKGSRDGFVAKLSETSLAVTSPNGAEILHVGFSWIVTWNTSGKVDKVTIEYSVDDGTDWFMVAHAIPNTGSYAWDVPDDVSANCLVRVSEAETAVPTDSSDAVFSISNDPILVVTSPNGGEQWAAGSTQTISWRSGGAVGDVKIEYSTDGGTSYSLVAADVQNTGSYAWIVPSAISSLGVIRITDISVSTTTDMSDNVFSIVAGTLTSLAMTSPNGGETLHVGLDWTITWQTVGQVAKVTLQYSVDGGTNWFMVASAIPNTGSYRWTVPDDVSTNCLVRVSDASQDSRTDTSDAAFTISNAPIVIVASPNGGEKWVVGSSHAVTWKSSGAIGDIKIEYSTDGGANWTVITDTTSNSGTFPWIVPNAVSDLCLIRITGRAAGNLATDTSDLVFSIVRAASPAASPGAKAGNTGPASGGLPGANARRRFVQGESR
jgi:hypothetical protein